MNLRFEGGLNIAVKIPKAKYDQTVAFYREILKLDVEERYISTPTVSKTHKVKFGPNTMWLDCVDNYTHSETWLELNVNDIEKATDYLHTNGVATCDELEKIPESMHWIMDPSGTVFIMKERG